MTRLAILAILLVSVLYSGTANAIEVLTVPNKGAADLLYVETPKAEADWLVYRVRRASEAGDSPVLWFEDNDGEGMPFGATTIFVAPKAQAEVKIHFVFRKSFARCKRKCNLLNQSP